ncbi:uncharacterized protein LOC115927087 [Strongylocentrotus purpuratus]|uniref:Uncharacterized protein n=1 Tax=Strongylocentrotus purpuratus TaxID=7668 RepID=A0A7M7PAE1_STRPU|nr:uncharacterized protein LOC115927087 [Strongylocentrotus purpuratus]
MSDTRYLVDATHNAAYDTSYSPSPHDGPINWDATPSRNLDYSTQGQGMFSNGPADMPSTGVDIDSSVSTPHPSGHFAAAEQAPLGVWGWCKCGLWVVSAIVTVALCILWLVIEFRY